MWLARVCGPQANGAVQVGDASCKNPQLAELASGQTSLVGPYELPIAA
jgi:hypothetical protein